MKNYKYQMIDAALTPGNQIFVAVVVVVVVVITT